MLYLTFVHAFSSNTELGLTASVFHLPPSKRSNPDLLHSIHYKDGLAFRLRGKTLGPKSTMHLGPYSTLIVKAMYPLYLTIP